MRAKVLTVVYAAMAVQRFLLPVPEKLPTVTDGASMLTEMIVILGFSVLASDVTAFIVGKVKGGVFDRPFSWPLRRTPTSAAAPSTEASPPAAPGSQPAGSPALQAAPVAAKPAGEASGQSTLPASDSSVAQTPSGGGGGTFASTLASVAGVGRPEVSK